MAETEKGQTILHDIVVSVAARSLFQAAIRTYTTGLRSPKPNTFDDDLRGFPGKPRAFAEADDSTGTYIQNSATRNPDGTFQTKSMNSFNHYAYARMANMSLIKTISSAPAAAWVRLALTRTAMLLCFATPQTARAQLSTTASINGTITDTSGAAVPGAFVTAVDQNTQVSTNTTSNEDGGFVLPGLP